MQRYLVVNADDFGLSPAVNAGVAESHCHGIVSSASLMVRQSAASDAADMARRYRELSVGLHLDLGEWRYDGVEWKACYEVVDLTDRGDVYDELNRQLERFHDLMGQPPTHLDSHQHVHRSEPVASIALRLAQRLDIPLRNYTPTVEYRGEFYGQTERGEPLAVAISVQALCQLIATLRPGISELGCHPAHSAESSSVYSTERTLELASLCDPSVRAALVRHDVQLISFIQARQLARRRVTPVTA